MGLNAKQRKKRREKMERRKNRSDWGKSPRNWRVVVVLGGGVDITLPEFCPGPEEAISRAVWAERDYIMDRVGSNRVRAKAIHEHLGVVVDDTFVIPDECPYSEFTHVAVEMADNVSRSLESMRIRAASILRDRSVKIIKQKMIDESDIAIGAKADPGFKVSPDDISIESPDFGGK
jgi:hypothetical protein